MRPHHAALKALACLLVSGAAITAAAQTSGNQGAPTPQVNTPGQFAVSPSGAASYRIPIQVPPGVVGMQPRLEVVYSSQSGNGMLGQGWGLSGLSAINRCPRTQAQDGVRAGVNFDANDRFCLDGQRLILVAGTYGAAGSEYRTELESFAKITAVGSAGSGPASFFVKTKSGLTMEFGNSADSRIEAIKAASGTSAWTTGTVRTWAQNKLSDVKGNYLTIAYSEDSTTGAYLPNRIDYNGNASASPALAPGYSVVFVPASTNRLDAITGYQAGASYTNTKRLAKIQTYTGTTLIKEYRLDYMAQASAMDLSKLSSITECDAAGACLPATTTQWGTPKTAAFNIASTWVADFGTANSWSDASTYPRQVVDVNGDGLPDIVGFGPSGVMVSLNTGTGFAAATSWIAQFGTAQGWTNNSVHPRHVVDVNGDGRPDILGFGVSGVMVSLNTGTAFAPATNWIPHFVSSGGSWTDNNTYPRFVVDLNGDGLPDLVGFAVSGAMVALNTGTAFAEPSFWLTGQFGTGTGWSDNNLSPRYLTDVNGDGLPDILGFSPAGIMVSLNTGTSFASATNWIPHYGSSGGSWTDNNTFPRFVVDLNGDGLPDIVGFAVSGAMVALNTGKAFAEPSFWLTGQFGTGAGWTDNNVQPRQLMDVNADGLPDVVGFGPAGVMVALNTGTGFATPTSWISGFGTSASWTNNTTHPRMLVDVTGDGVPDVVGFFSSGVSVATNQQDVLPNYLGSLNNGLGATTTVSYAALTQGSVYTRDSGATAASFPQVDIKAPLYVVNTHASSNDAGGVSTTTYTYGGLKVELGTGRGMLGFRWISSKDGNTNIENYNEFRQDYPYVGMPARSEQRLSGAGNGGLLKRSISALGCKVPANGSTCVVPVRCDLSANATACVNAANARYFRYVASTADESWDINGAVYPASKLSTDYGVDATDGKLYGDPSVVSLATSDGAIKSSANEYWPADTSNWILGRLKKSTVTSTTVAIAGSGTAADPYQPPTITASQSPSDWVATLPGNLSWTSTNATLVSYSCTSSGAGFTASETVWPNGSTPSQTVSEAWVGIPSNCVFTATGPGGTATYNLTVNTLPAPRVPVTVNLGTQANYVANIAKAAGYIAGRTDITFNITGTIGSASTGQYAFIVDNSWAPGDTVNIVINAGAGIYGAGGAGGTGFRSTEDGGYSATAGGSGGPALQVQRPATVTNNGSIAGGGGGGGGGSTGVRQSVSSGAAMMYVSGGDGGRGQGAGASGLYAATGGTSGYHGTLYGSPWDGGDGGSGGAVGNAGGAGGYGTNGYYGPAGGGGSSGSAVVGNANVTWTVAGTRLGALQ